MVLSKVLKRIRRFVNRLRYFLLPNFARLLGNRLVLAGGLPICGQLMVVRGEGKVTIGKGCSFGARLGGFNRGGCVELQPRRREAVIEIGDRVLTNNNVFITAMNRVVVGADTLIGQNVMITDYEAHGTHPLERRKPGRAGEVVVGQNVWIGNNVTILRDTTIGNDSIVAAGAVVKGTFPSGVVLGGVPAKVIKTI
jgi:acetyltransferase-like isoleucine patch superfamily enzyme